jgi:hypothetical protein
MEIPEYKLKTLQPGFLIIFMDVPRSITIKDWSEMEKKGWSGGLIVPLDTEIDSLDEKLMNDLGWQRITGR